MGGVNTIKCMQNQCPQFRRGHSCDGAVELHSSSILDPGQERIRTFCGFMLDTASSEVSEEECLSAMIDGNRVIPPLTDEIID